jgi:hypothetical protein
MEGRFLTAPVLCGALAVGQLRWSGRAALALVPACVLIAGLGTRHPWWPDTNPGDHPPPRIEDGIADERSHYAASASALAWRPGRSMPAHRWREQGERGPEDGASVAVFSTLGFYGFFADPELHVVDGFALADPLLARLAPVRRVDWKAGHLPRVLPEGYVATLAGDPLQIQISDPGVARLYEAVVRVHHGPIFARGRGAAIVELISGRAIADIDPHRHYLAELVRVDARTLARRRSSVRFRDAGVEIEFGDRSPDSSSLGLTLSPGQRYVISFQLGDTELSRRELETAGVIGGVPVPVELELPEQDFDRVYVLPLTMHGKRSLELGSAARAR